MQLHTIKRKTAQRAETRVGRGGKRGKTSGKGTKGQKARAGGRPRPEMRDIIKKIPKLRGHGKNRARTVVGSRIKPSVVNLAKLDALFEAKAVVSPKALLEKGVVNKVSGQLPAVKILGEGEITKPITVADCTVSTSARTKIEAAGGTVR